MTLMKVFSKVEKDGKIKLPANIQLAAGLKEGQLIELKIVGTSANKSILITAMKSARQPALIAQPKGLRLKEKLQSGGIKDGKET